MHIRRRWSLFRRALALRIGASTAAIRGAAARGRVLLLLGQNYFQRLRLPAEALPVQFLDRFRRRRREIILHKCNSAVLHRALLPHHVAAAYSSKTRESGQQFFFRYVRPAHYEHP